MTYITGTEWIFSKATYQFLGGRTTEVSYAASPAGKVTMTSTSAVLSHGIANSPGGPRTLVK